MRTTIDIPDALFRRTKALAAARGVTLKQLVIDAVDFEDLLKILSSPL